ncbi:MAG: hypothetical protein E7129_02500 [Rikenellaceae bacterium]|nr:hypothetical protein [Rikenellaceae bacterium]
MKKLMFLIGVVALMFTASCIKGPASGGSSAANYNGKIVVTDATSGEVTYTDNNASVTVAIPNIIEPKFDITFNGVKFAELMPIKLNLALKGIPFTTTVSEDETTINYIFDAKDIIPEGFDEQYLINRVWGSIGRRIEISFTMINEKRNSHVTFTSGNSDSSVE